MQHRSVVLVVTFAAALGASHARADTATAEALFREGKQLMAEGKYELACQKLADSYRADPATGALLATALCYEKAGKTASAWAAYTEVAARAKSERSEEREQAARARIAALEPKLSRLTVEVAPANTKLTGFSVLRDGEAWARGAWNTPVPVDPGTYAIEARASGRKSFSAKVQVKPGGDRAAIRVPELAPESASAPVAEPDAAAHTGDADPAARDAGTGSGMSLRTWGYITGGVGVVGIGVGAFFGLRAMGKNEDSKADCDGNVCGPEGTDARKDARSSGTISTIAVAAGGVLVGAGVTLFVLGGEKSGESRVSLHGGASSDGASAVLRGTF